MTRIATVIISFRYYREGNTSEISTKNLNGPKDLQSSKDRLRKESGLWEIAMGKFMKFHVDEDQMIKEANRAEMRIVLK